MLQNEDRYRRALREPLRALFKALAPIANRLNPYFNTEAKYGRVLSAIRRRWIGSDGVYQDRLWGAFYRADHTRHDDVQLFVSLNQQGCTVGVGIFHGSADQLAGFHQLAETDPPRIFLVLSPLLADGFECYVQTAESEVALQVTEEMIIRDSLDPAVQTAFERAETFSVTRFFPREDDLLFRPEFADEVSAILERLYPIYRLLIGEINDADHEPDSIPQRPLDSSILPAERETSVPSYSLEQFQRDTLLPVEQLQTIQSLILEKQQLVLYGPPGTGKTYVARKLAQLLLDAHGGMMRTIQFHEAYAYEEFIEGLRPQSVDGQIIYAVEPGVFLQFCEQARANPHQRFVLIIDELNRGNVPRIFGELLYLLEYRESNEAILLPYSKALFNIPKNVFLIGTMNTADRALIALDQALRRRFHFFPLRPNPEVLRLWLMQQGKLDLLWLPAVVEELNRRLVADGVDAENLIGHTLWMRPDLDERRVSLIWDHTVLPMLEALLLANSDWPTHYDLTHIRAAAR
jgi:uncharacterized protein (DUF2461 family)/energy-coupling factor transporter ATP-binding protein EcfA2